MDSIVKQLRLKNKLSQDALAKRVHTSRQTINSLEKGRFEPSIGLAYKLSKLFDVTIEQLFDLTIYEKDIIQLGE